MMQKESQSNSVWSQVEPYCVLQRIWKNLWMVLMSAALFAMLAYIATSLFYRPSYSCSATFVVTPRNSNSSLSSTVTSSTTDQFAKLLEGQTLINRVQRLQGAEVAGATASASAVPNSNLIELRTTGPSPRSAYYLCTGILDHYEDYSQYVFDSVMLDTVSAPVVPNKNSFLVTQRRIVLIAAPLGALFMAAVLALLCITSGTIQTVQGARSQLDGSLLVTLNHQRKRRTLKRLLKRRKSALLISNPTTSFLYVETIHQLRARVDHANQKYGCKTFLITSVTENEGKSTVAANLALSLARRHKKVLLVDCDLRKSAQHLIFEVSEKTVSLNSLLKGSLEPEKLVKALHYRKAENLFFLFAENVHRHSAELLGSEQMGKLLEILRENFDFVILDSSPMGFFTDSEVLSDAADASILVLRQDMLTDRTINDAIDSLSRCKSRFLGYVFNDVHTLNMAARIVGGRRYGYGYGYGHGYGYGYGYSKSRSYGYSSEYGPSGDKQVYDSAERGEDVSLTTAERKGEKHGTE